MSDTAPIMQQLLGRIEQGIESRAARQAQATTEKLMAEITPIIEAAEVGDSLLFAKLGGLLLEHLRERNSGAITAKVARHLLDGPPELTEKHMHELRELGAAFQASRKEVAEMNANIMKVRDEFGEVAKGLGMGGEAS